MHNSDVTLLRSMQPDDLAPVLEWRNHPDVSRYMLSRHEITATEHRQWFERSSADGTRRLYLLTRGGERLGFAQLTGVSFGATATWGFYVRPGAPRGTGSRLGSEVLRAAFSVERLHKVCGQALDLNDASQRLHVKLGFTLEGTLRQHVQVDGRYRDLLCYGILADEFAGARNE